MTCEVLNKMIWKFKTCPKKVFSALANGVKMSGKPHNINSERRKKNCFNTTIEFGRIPDMRLNKLHSILIKLQN